MEKINQRLIRARNTGNLTQVAKNYQLIEDISATLPKVLYTNGSINTQALNKYYTIVSLYRENQDFTKALKTAQFISKETEKLHPCYFKYLSRCLLAISYLDAGELYEGWTLTKKLLDEESLDYQAEGFCVFAKYYGIKGNHEREINMYKEAYKVMIMDQFAPPIEKFEIFCGLALAYEDAHKPVQAIALYLELLSLLPSLDTHIISALEIANIYIRIARLQNILCRK